MDFQPFEYKTEHHEQKFERFPEQYDWKSGGVSGKTGWRIIPRDWGV
jgi:hypothetical protein